MSITTRLARTSVAASGVDLRFAGGAAMLFGLALFAIRWIGRMLKDSLGDGSPSDPMLSPVLVAGVPGSDVATTLTRRGVVTADQLAGMSAKEQQFFLTMTAALPTRDTSAKPAVIRTPRNTPRGVAVNALYCPTCAALLSREAALGAGGAPCPKCGHTVSAREQYGKLVVTVAVN